MIISYDYGHGVPYDVGAVGFLNEDKVVKEYGSMVVRKLEALGNTCINCTPSSASSLRDSLSQRTNKSNASGASLHLSFHVNSFSSSSARGCECLYVSSKGKEYSTRICNEIAKIGFYNRGAKYRNDLWILNNTKAVSVIIEPFFVTNRSDCNLYEANKERLADAIVKGVTGTSSPSVPSGGGNGNNNVYVVKSGDTLSAIANKYGTTVANLVKINNISNPNIIRIGQKIIVNGSSSVRPITGGSSSLKELQRQFNIQGCRDSAGNMLAEDGIYGPKLQSAADKCAVGRGAKGEITRWIQNRLISLSYNVGAYGADGIFGMGTKEAVKAFQRDRGLSADGIVGSKTWQALMK